MPLYSLLSVTDQQHIFCNTVEKKYDLPWVILCIDSKSIRFILDTGSTRSYLSSNIFDSLNKHLTGPSISFTAANSQISKTSGSFYNTFSFGSLKIELKLHVSNNLPIQGLLGMDFLSQFTINFPLKILSHFGHQKIKFQISDNIPVSIDHQDFSEVNLCFDVNSDFVLNTSVFTEAIAEKCVFPTAKKLELNIFDKSKFNVDPSLSIDIQEKYYALLCEFQDLFQESLNPTDRYLGPEKLIISLTNNRPQRGPTFEIPKALEPDFTKYMSNLENLGFIEPCECVLYNHGYLPITKKCGETRWCSDMRCVNSVTETNAYTLPRLNDLLANVNGHKVYAGLDLLTCFTQFEISPESRNITAFTNPLTGKRYRYTRAFFGLKLMPNFVAYIMQNIVFSGMPQENFCCFIDDIILGDSSHTQVMEMLRDVFLRLRTYGLKIKAKKCAFGYSKIDAFGYEISQKGISIPDKRLEFFDKLQPPTSSKTLLQNVSSLNYYRCNIQNFSKYTAILMPLTKKGHFEWTDKTQLAWDGLMLALKNHIIISKPDFDKPFILKTDACGKSCGAILVQNHTGNEIIVGIFSKIFANAQINYHINILELLGTILAVEHFSKILLGRKFTIIVDSSWVFYLLTRSEKIFYQKPGVGTRLLMRLAQYNFDVQIVKGVSTSFQLTDMISR